MIPVVAVVTDRRTHTRSVSFELPREGGPIIVSVERFSMDGEDDPPVLGLNSRLTREEWEQVKLLGDRAWAEFDAQFASKP